ncbi:MAG: rhodanese-like domain-containing protein [Piscirickettsiaceae bacterium]|nr:rhodanese-like domain-containing protein [Piscirickettsiaceae bacterium]
MENLGEFIVNHWVLATLFVVLTSLVMSGSLNSKLAGMTAIDAAEAVQIINQQNGLFLDIREVSEFAKEHIADSKNIPLSKLADESSTLKDQAQAIILVCASGQRTSAAAKQLRKQGFSNIYALKGGLNTWKEAKLPLFS